MGVIDQFKVSDKVALVTGGYRGLGKAFAAALADAGADVVIAARNAAAAEDAASDLAAQSGRKVIGLGVDISDRSDVERLMSEIVSTFGRIDIVVNNAGTCIHRPALEVPDEEFRQVFDINVYGLWLVSTIAAQQMVEQGGGTIVNVGSISAQIVNRPQWQPAYNASKAAVHQLTKSLAAEWAPYDIRVNAVAPGYVKTEMAPVDEPRFRQHWIEDAPMKRYAMPEEIAPTVVYLASPASSFMTGSIVNIDGGYTVF